MHPLVLVLVIYVLVVETIPANVTLRLRVPSAEYLPVDAELRFVLLVESILVDAESMDLFPVLYVDYLPVDVIHVIHAMLIRAAVV